MSLMSISARSGRTARVVRLLLALSLVVLVTTTLAGCQAAPTPTPTPIVQVVVITATPADTPIPAPSPTPVVLIVTATPVPTEKPAEGASLQVDGPDGAKALSLEELKKLPATEGWGGIKSSTGKITPPMLFRGVSLEDLAKLAGTFDASTALNVVAKDGYAMTFSYDQITTGAFTAFDPGAGDELKRAEPLKVIVAYERDGQPIPEESDGSLRLAIVTPKNDQVTDGHWAVKWVRQIVLKPASAEWTLHLEGAIVEEMDRNTFESGAAPNCHLAQWTDADGKVWSGIPLYYLMGRVDDAVTHEGDAFDAPLAEKGYEVDVVAADGYKVTFDSAWLAYNKTVILAILVDGEPLPEDVFPLRLVGSSLKKGEMVGAVAQIVLHVDQVSAAEPAPAASTGTPRAWAWAASPESESHSTAGPGPIQALADLDTYPWPDLETVNVENLDRAAQVLPEGLGIITGVGGIFTRTWMIMGYEHFCLSLIENPELVARVAERVGRTQCAVLRRLVNKPHVFAIWYGDDLGYTEGLLASPRVLRKLFFPWMEELATIARGAGMPFIMHTDGNLWLVLDDLIALGVCGLNPIEAKAMDIYELKRRYGHKLTLIGNIDLGYTLQAGRGRPEDVRAEVRQKIKDLAPGGGYCVASGSGVTRYVTLEQFIAMRKATFEFGQYPIRL